MSWALHERRQCERLQTIVPICDRNHDGAKQGFRWRRILDLHEKFQESIIVFKRAASYCPVNSILPFEGLTASQSGPQPYSHLLCCDQYREVKVLQGEESRDQRVSIEAIVSRHNQRTQGVPR